MESLFVTEGYYDLFNCNKPTLVASGNAPIAMKRRVNGFHDSTRKKYIYEFIISPTMGFLGSPEPLMPDCELKLSFDRTPFSNAIVEMGTPNETCTKLEIKDCVAYTEYVSSPSLQQYFAKIDTNPIIYQYDECEVLIKNIPKTETTIRFDNLKGGNIPSYLFAAVIPQAALDGDIENSSTYFQHENVEEFNITLNGKRFLLKSYMQLLKYIKHI